MPDPETGAFPGSAAADRKARRPELAPDPALAEPRSFRPETEAPAPALQAETAEPAVAATVLWTQSLGPLLAVQTEMVRWFGEFWRTAADGFGQLAAMQSTLVAEPQRAQPPPPEVKVTDDAYRLSVELGGLADLDTDRVEARIVDGRLVLVLPRRLAGSA